MISVTCVSRDFFSIYVSSSGSVSPDAYYKALPYIVELRNKGDKKDVSELENCFDALYGVMLLRLQHKPISDETAKAVADITKLLAMLSDYYKQDKAGELKFE